MSKAGHAEGVRSAIESTLDVHHAHSVTLYGKGEKLGCYVNSWVWVIILDFEDALDADIANCWNVDEISVNCFSSKPSTRGLKLIYP